MAIQRAPDFRGPFISAIPNPIRELSPQSPAQARYTTRRQYRVRKHESTSRALKLQQIRNFCIVAHIDHGKSTLADRLIELTGTLEKREMKEQVLDTLDLERERGITIKLNAVRMQYRARDGVTYELNLIDTPGHVDFTYEVSRSLAACEGAILVVDASQGIQAQTLSNLLLALDAGLEIIPVLNKIDLPGAEPERRKAEVHDLIGVAPDDILLVSAKEGRGIDAVLEAIVQRVPPPRGDPAAPLRALIFDSYYDRYRGAIPSVRVVDGEIRPGMAITFGTNAGRYEVAEVGYLQLRQVRAEALTAGEVGYVVANVRTVKETRAGDTIFDADRPAQSALPGYKDVHSMVFAGVYPTDTQQYEQLRDALSKLQLNDASLKYEPETSTALGFGFRCGFLGLLHMEIVQQRLEREFDLSLITTVPNVEYHVYRTDGSMELIENPSKMPPPANLDRIEEPYVKARIMAPVDYIGPIMTLGNERRGVYHGMKYLDPTRVEFEWEFPLAEIIIDFYDRLKTISRGYAGLDYELADYRPGDLVRLDMLINGDPVDAFSVIIHSDKAYDWGRKIAGKLKELIPRQLFEVAIQAAIGNKVIARTTVKPLRKDVLAKCYGGDITRKRKLLEKQKEGKKRMKQVGSVEIPQEAFLAVLQVD
jgi:GTP-binding protein LepA